MKAENRQGLRLVAIVIGCYILGSILNIIQHGFSASELEELPQFLLFGAVLAPLSLLPPSSWEEGNGVMLASAWFGFTMLCLAWFLAIRDKTRKRLYLMSLMLGSGVWGYTDQESIYFALSQI